MHDRRSTTIRTPSPDNGCGIRDNGASADAGRICDRAAIDSMGGSVKHTLIAACFAALTVAANALSAMAETRTEDLDPFLWLEDIEGDEALAWVRERNAATARELEASPHFAALNARLLAAFDSDERIPYVVKRDSFYYNFWRDKTHVRGLWRRTTLDEYRKPSPAWETVLDLDALAEQENENWVWGGAGPCLQPDQDRCLLLLSRGGSDAKVVREFDLRNKSFVKDGFNLPAAKSDVAWRDRDSIYVGTDFGPGTLTASEYPRLVKLWRRGKPLESAELVFEGKPEDVSVSGWTSVDRVGDAYVHRNFIWRGITYFESEWFVHEDGLHRLDLPAHVSIATFADRLLIAIKQDWRVGDKVYRAGSLLAAPWDEFRAGKRNFHVLFEPMARSSLDNFTTTRRFVLVNVLDNIRSRIYAHSLENGAWTQRELPVADFGSVDVSAVDPLHSDDYFLTTTGFLTPNTLALGTVGKDVRETLKQSPAFFDARGLKVTQHEAVSKDGTRVPYFQIAREDLALDGKAPTLLYGYGGFQISSTPAYSASVGIGWLEQGGVYVLANIRGGGEFGPPWHLAAIKENRQRAFDDFIAVAEDLIRRKVTSPKHLGIMGGSNGGLLVGAVMMQRPDLFGAVVCQVPLLDMRRYHRLLAGASWMAEYGNPDDPAEWAYISKYSPYHNVRAGTTYPRVLFVTSTRDDRVHPGHARKMAAKMQTAGADVLYYENIEGGHGGAANNRQAAYMSALAYAFLRKQLFGS
jgi:prolyl oligopeptidase